MASYKDYQDETKRNRRLRVMAVMAMLLVIVLLVVGLAYVASRMLTGKALFDPVTLQSTPGADLGTADVSQPAPNSTPATDGLIYGEQLFRTWNINTPIEHTLSTEVVSTDAKMLALPANGRVSREYFRTSLFIGDSLMQGMALYNQGLKDIATVAAFKGTTPQQIVANAVGELPDYTKVPMLEYIQQQTPMNIYLGIGTNALVAQRDNEAFLKYYGDLLDVLQQSFPNIPIYVQSITPVTAATAQNRPDMDNDRIRLLNNAIALMAVERGMYYVNLHEVLADETGCLREDIASSKDGFHMRDGTGYEIWVDYLQTHTAYNAYNLQFLEEPYTA